jgi:hypothetical protein
MVAARARGRSGSDAKAFAAAATVAFVRVVELEAFIEALANEVQLRAVDIGEALGVDQDFDAMVFARLQA